ncbi:sensor histidine kinase [Sphaerisporangium perillae]|uniref:sensor histidine kinase n=1 Tax=Sphaerisporangium perillae TaxID=2935860 RepID=UPI00200D5E19|nr:HAMP domain-containing sensor histidine kinase [Sphaerisporangium perillae]
MAKTEWLEARQESTLVAAADRLGRLEDPIKPDLTGVTLIQVVAPDHRVVAASPAVRGLPPLTTVWPSPADPEQDVRTCAHQHLGCVNLAAQRVSNAADSNVVYAGDPAPAGSITGVIDSIFVIQGIALILLAVAMTWKVTGRTLRPVEAIRAELAAINVNDLSTRVPQPVGNDEIARLAHTVNGTLTRLEHAKDQMEQALNHQRQFAADASHELRTPVAGLRAQLEEAQLHPEDTDLKQLLNYSLRDVDRLQAIITDLLLLERVNTGTPQSRTLVDLAEIVRAEVARRPGRFPVRLDLAPDVTIDAVRTQIGRVLGNLLDNAERHARRSVSVTVRREGDTAELIVDDDGDGIAMEDRERIFQRFTRLDAARSRDRGGTGLGLAIARDIIETHGGTIVAATSPAGGARFIGRIPLAKSSQAGRSRTASPA